MNKKEESAKVFEELKKKYDEAYISEATNSYIVKQNGKYGMVSLNGTCVTPCCFEKIYLPMNNFMVIENEGKFGLISTHGLFIEPIYDEVETEFEDFCKVTLNGKTGWLDKDGKFTEDEEEAVIGCFLD
jgi:hypothetical protein